MKTIDQLQFRKPLKKPSQEYIETYLEDVIDEAVYNDETSVCLSSKLLPPSMRSNTDLIISTLRGHGYNARLLNNIYSKSIYFNLK